MPSSLLAAWVRSAAIGSGPHEHIYGRWRKSDPFVYLGTPFAQNERRCIRCGWCEVRRSDQETHARQ